MSYFVLKLGPGAEFPTLFTKCLKFFKAEGWKSPVSATNNAYTLTHRLSRSQTMFDHARSDQEYFSNFNKALIMQGITTIFAIGIFPFKAELSKLETTDDTVLVVNVGGYSTRQIKQLYGDVKGRMIFQDQPETIESIRRFDILHSPFSSRFGRREVCGNFEEHILFSDSEVTSLIAEYVLSEVGVNVEIAWLDYIMMTFGGRERTEAQWVDILTDAGLRFEKTYSMAGSHYGLVEAYLK